MKVIIHGDISPKAWKNFMNVFERQLAEGAYDDVLTDEDYALVGIIKNRKKEKEPKSDNK